MGPYDGVKLSTGNDSAWRYTAPNEPLNGPEFTPGDDSLFIFKNNQCKPECCGSSYSCGGGCVCTTPQQRQYIAGRGGNRNRPEDSLYAFGLELVYSRQLRCRLRTHCKPAA